MSRGIPFRCKSRETTRPAALLNYSASYLPPGLSIDPSSGLISGTIAQGAGVGSPYTIAVSASDGTNQATQSFDWTVMQAANLPPTITNQGDQANREGDAVALTIAGNDPDGDPLVYNASGLPDGLSIDSSSGLIWGTIATGASASGPYTTTVSADDGNGATVSQTFNWSVGDSLISAQGVAQSGTEGLEFSDAMVASFTDADPSRVAGDFTATIAWGDGVAGPGQLVPADNGFAVTGSHVYAHPGTMPIQMTITDSEGATVNVSTTASLARLPCRRRVDSF